MPDLSPEILSRYADGEVCAEEALAIEAGVAKGGEAAARLAEIRALGALFGEVEPEPVPREVLERLYALRPVARLASFEPIPAVRVRRIGWPTWAAAAATLLAAVFGIRQLTWRPEVEVTAFARQEVGAGGKVVQTQRLPQVILRAGDRIAAGPGERLSFRLPGGAMVVLPGGSEVRVGDPRTPRLFSLERGTALCTLTGSGGEREVLAGGYVLHSERADFGLRLEGLPLRAAGPAAREAPALTVAVSRGSLEVGENGGREPVGAFERAVFRRGAAVERSGAWQDPLYGLLLEAFQTWATEILPGYFSVEQGVLPIEGRRWRKDAQGGLVLALTDSDAAAVARYLVLHVRASTPTPLTLTRIRPWRDVPGQGETVTVKTAEVDTGWTVVAVPLDAFASKEAERGERALPVGRRGLVRLELRPAATGATLDLKASLWAARPPAEQSEVAR